MDVLASAAIDPMTINPNCKVRLLRRRCYTSVGGAPGPFADHHFLSRKA
jgi:hypothetical protein